MSNLQLLQQLKQRINCSSPVALQLLKQTDNDLAKAEQLFHEQNLDFIQQQANCDRELAEKFYHRCQQNVEEAIAQATGWILHGRISKSVITTADEKYSAHPHRLCFILTARDKNDSRIMDIDTIEQTYTIIPIEDVWEYLYNKEVNVFDFHDDFSPYFDNDFSLEQIDTLVKNLQNLTHTDPKVMKFYQELMDWLINCKKFAHHLQIYGNV